MSTKEPDDYEVALDKARRLYAEGISSAKQSVRSTIEPVLASVSEPGSARVIRVQLSVNRGTDALSWHLRNHQQVLCDYGTDESADSVPVIESFALLGTALEARQRNLRDLTLALDAYKWASQRGVTLYPSLFASWLDVCENTDTIIGEIAETAIWFDEEVTRREANATHQK